MDGDGELDQRRRALRSFVRGDATEQDLLDVGFAFRVTDHTYSDSPSPAVIQVSLRDVARGVLSMHADQKLRRTWAMIVINASFIDWEDTTDDLVVNEALWDMAVGQHVGVSVLSKLHDLLSS